jgi:hypothetical protein
MACGGNGRPLDYEELERWTRLGFERGRGHEKGRLPQHGVSSARAQALMAHALMRARSHGW